MKRILLDECVSGKFRAHLAPHPVSTVARQRLQGLRNGRLLERAQVEFDVLLTVDQSMRFQQHIARFDIALVVFRATTSNIEDSLPCVPEFLRIVEDLRPGTATVIG